MHIIITRGELIWIHIRACRRAFAMKCSRRLTVSVKMLDLFRYDWLIECWTCRPLDGSRCLLWPNIVQDAISFLNLLKVLTGLCYSRVLIPQTPFSRTLFSWHYKMLLRMVINVKVMSVTIMSDEAISPKIVYFNKIFATIYQSELQ